MRNPTEPAGTVEKAIDVLFHLHAAAGPRGVTAVGRELGLPKSSAHRLLAALSRRGLVEQDSRGRYRPGIGLVALGLAADLVETFFLVAARAGALGVLDKAEGKGFLRAAPQIGAEVPVHATAVGKLFLAFGGGEIAAPEEPFESFAPRTRITARSLAEAVQRARRRGYAENREEWIPGLAVLAAPVLAGERLLAAVAVAAPVARYDALGGEELARRAVAAGERIASRVEGRGL